MTDTTKLKKSHKDERGLVSFIVTLLLMIVISLIVLGFARITRREQRQALDRQLSTAAYYAAESGANDARDYIKKQIATAGLTSLLPKDNCDPVAAPAVTYPQQFSATISNTCTLIDPYPSSLVFKPVNTESSKIFPITTAPPTTLNSVTFYWQDPDGGTDVTNCPTSTTFPASWPTSNCDTGMLRVDLVPLISPMNRDTLTARTMTAFLYPNQSGGGSVLGPNIEGLTNQGAIIEGKCDGTVPFGGGTAPQQCRVTISNLSGTYYARVKAIYKSSNVTVRANDITVVGGDRLVGAQAIIDSTGKANDVVRRIQVNVPLLVTGKVPEMVVDSIDSICKKFAVTSTAVSELPFKPACDLN